MFTRDLVEDRQQRDQEWMVGRYGLDLSGPRQKQVAGCCTYGNITSDDVQCGENFILLHGVTKSVPHKPIQHRMVRTLAKDMP